MPNLDISNFAKNDDPQRVEGGRVSQSGPQMTAAGVKVTNPHGLRRWRVAHADALFAEAPIVFGGDSRVYGENANGSVSFTPTDGRANAPLCMVGQLRSLFAQQYGDPGEGFIFPNGVYDSGAVVAGAGFAFINPGQAVGQLRQNWRLPTTTATVTMPAAPANNAFVKVLLSSHAGEDNGLYQINGGANTSLGFGTGDDKIALKSVAVTSGQVLNLVNNAGGNVTYSGLQFRTALVGGVPVHRIGIPGNTIGDWQGGVFNGQVGTYDGTNFYTAAQQKLLIQAMYSWNPTPGLLVVHTGGNEQTNQNNSSGIGSGITPALFKTLVQNVVNTAVADGWAVLLLGPNPSGAEVFSASLAPSTQYTAQLQQVAQATDHCAFIDLADLWGGPGQQGLDDAFNAGLRDHFSAHPTRKGYGDQARHLHRVLNMTVPVGN